MFFLKRGYRVNLLKAHAHATNLVTFDYYQLKIVPAKKGLWEEEKK